ncbi:MAG TPA: PilX N-terminal domain-containing pilus assembly protein [Thermoanaerobaculia bacterium]
MKSFRRKTARVDQKGSALLVSLMVMAGLSLLGLAFVAISETESAISVNERNYVQAQAAAEAGAKIAVEWFQDAEWAFDRGLLPENKTALKTKRSTDVTASQYYKGVAGELLFDVPFKIVDNNKFFGNVDTADVTITYGANTTATNYLKKLNAVLFPNNTAGDELRISDIRVYAPPIPGAELVDGTGDGGWWKGGQARYGVATIRVTAQKLSNDKVVAQRTVKLVVAETPFPTVDGAIETSGSLVGQGNFHVYWGKILSEKETQVNRPAVGMPWFDANEVMNFEYGYDSTREWTASTVYPPNALIHPPNTAVALDPELEKFAYRTTAGGTSHSAAPPITDWKKAIGGTFTETSGIQWKAEASRPFRIDATDPFYSENPWLYSLLGQTIADPWLHARARGEIVVNNNKTVPCGSTVLPHPCDFATVNEVVAGRMSNLFQNQTFTDTATIHPERVEVFFPTMDYEFWKNVAMSGDNQPGNDLYYFKYDQATNQFIGPAGVKKPIEQWLNAEKNGLGAGFYFFDSKNGKNPQYGKGGTLTPGVKINAAVGKPWQMQGYIYLNAENFGTTGQGNLVDDDVYPMPGEPYRDVGYREVDTATNDYTLVGGALPAGNFKTIGQGNKVWDFQDVNENGVFDWHVALNTVPLTRPNGAVIPVGTVWLPVPWTPGCKVPDMADMSKAVAGTCSEPHEPYINIIYPNQGGAHDAVQFGWHDPTNVTMRKPKKRLSKNSVEACKSTTALKDCTSNGYDLDGAYVTLAPLLHGALYNEGGYDGSGNAVYYGAVLMRGNFSASGTPEVFFNECLARGCLESQLEMQRVMVTSYETDQ